VTQGQIDSAFDVNDVSILFPLKKDSAHGGVVPYPAIRSRGVVDEGQDILKLPLEEQLYSADVFNQVIKEATKHGLASGASNANKDFFKLQGLWHIVGLRFDPCAPGFDDKVLTAVGGKCLIQLRLIAQPFADGVSSEDFTTHLVYNLGAVPKSELATNPIILGATKVLGQIKDASDELGAKTAGQPLGVHPGLEAESKKGGSRVAGLVKTLIKGFTKTPSRALAFMGLEGGGPEPWTFFAGKVENNKFIPQAGPAHGQAKQTLSFIGNGPVVEKSKLPVSTSPLFDVDSDALTAEQRKLAFKVEDPNAQHFFNTDCISCHTSSARTHDLALGDKAEISARFPVPANITGYVTKAQAQDDAWNTRNFGYFGEKPTVSGRTVTETVEVVLWLNKNVRAPGAGLNGPGLDCTGVDNDVFKCFRDGKKDCMKACKAAPQPTPAVPTRDLVPIVINPEQAGDPCVTGTVGGEGTVQAEHSGSNIVVDLGGNNSACLTRVMGGAFVTEGLVVLCTGPTRCILTIADGAGDGNDSVTIKGEEAKRFRQFFRLKDGQFFQTRAGGETGLKGEVAGLQISCKADSCTATIAADKTTLPDLGAGRINPE
jgi:hypothetical protein